MTGMIEWIIPKPGARLQLVIVPGVEAPTDTKFRSTLVDLSLCHHDLRIGVFTYPNSLRNFSDNPSLSLQTVAKACADALMGTLQSSVKTVLIGHCFGGLILTMAFSQLPENRRSTTLVLLDTIADTAQTEISSWLGGLMEHLRVPETLLKDTAKWLQSPIGQSTPIFAVMTEAPSWVTQMRPDAFRPQSMQFVVPTDHDDLLMQVLQNQTPPFDLNALLNETRIAAQLKGSA